MFHLPNEHRLSIKVYCKYFLAIVYFDFADGEIYFFVKLKPSEPDSVIKMIKFGHSIVAAVCKNVQANQQTNYSNKEISHLVLDSINYWTFIEFEIQST